MRFTLSVSVILDIRIDQKEHPVAQEEKVAWIGLVVGIVTGVVYGAVLAARATGGPLVEAPYVDAMLWSIGIGIVVTAVVTIVVAILTRRDGQGTDVRDRQISARAEHTARAVLVIGALAALVLAMLEADHFWIAHALFIGFYASAVLEGITKVALYRGGVPAW